MQVKNKRKEHPRLPIWENDALSHDLYVPFAAF